MGTVTDILASIDSSVEATGGRFFTMTATALGPTATVLLTMFVVLIGVNIAIGAHHLSLRDATQLVWRAVLIYVFALSWANFGVIYNALSSGSANLATGFFNTAGGAASGPNAAMDGFARHMADTVDAVASSRGSIMRGVVGGAAYVFLAVLMAAYVLVVGFAKIMIAFLLGVAPLAMVATIFDKTRNLFEAWLEAFVGYLMYPIAAAAVITSVVTVAEDQFPTTMDEATLGSLLGFFVVVFVGIFALKAIPTAAAHLTGQFRLASITPEPVRAVAAPFTSRAQTLGRGMLSGGQTSQNRHQRLERVWSERGGKVAEKIRLSRVLGTTPKD